MVEYPMPRIPSNLGEEGREGRKGGRNYERTYRGDGGKRKEGREGGSKEERGWRKLRRRGRTEEKWEGEKKGWGRNGRSNDCGDGGRRSPGSNKSHARL